MSEPGEDEGEVVVVAHEPSPPPATARNWDLWFEIGTVLLICVIPHLFNSFASNYVDHAPTPFLYQALSRVLHSAGMIALILFVVARSGEPASEFGLGRFAVRRDLAGGVGTFVLAYAAYYVVWHGLFMVVGPRVASSLARQDLSMFARPSGAVGYALLVAMSVANGFAEELTMRAYLIPRFERVFGSTMLALLISSLLFATYHGYQGPRGVVSAMIIGLVYGGVFCVSRRIWPVALGHAIQDIVALLMMKG